MAKGRHNRKASGGGVSPSESPKNEHKTDPDMPVFAESAKKDDSFKRGGRKHKKHGGAVEGHKGHERADKRARGGRAMSKGGVLSSAASTSPAKAGSEDD